jgi:hypothetical protein
MKPARWRLTTDEARERFAAAGDRGGLCAVCGRTLGAEEPVYIAQVLVQRKPLPAAGTGWSTHPVLRDAPLGRECVAPALLARLERQEPDPCVRCGRPVYYEIDRAGRQQAMCSKRCEKVRRG